MEAIEALRGRRSVRAYEHDKPIPRETIEAIVDCGRLAATARNIQPWEFVVVTAAEKLIQIADITDHGKHIAQSAACIAVFCQDGKYYLEDGSAATQNILVAAWALGVGACWVAGDKKAYADKLRDLLGAPETHKLVSLVSLGYPTAVPNPNKRPLGDVLHWERY
ncbi:MAG TPA: nitroreductase family protein [Candidatus Hydrogenedentes bacterium]|nr:nitroreductase family protein [Candidatus Hydrogenedentota bacterium]